MRITVACPESLRADANQLAMVLAQGPADAHTYDLVNWKDGEGVPYACASFNATPDWIGGAQVVGLVRPDWDIDQIIDMEAAERAQAALVVWAYAEGKAPPAPQRGKLTAIMGMDGREAVEAMGLSMLYAQI